MSVVYVIAAKEVRKIKIGTTSDLARRLVEIQAMSPVKLEVVRAFTCMGREIESAIHHLCAEWHCHGEWFEEDALGQVDRWAEVVVNAANQAAKAIDEFVPASLRDQLNMRLRLAGANNIANALTNITGQSIMDKRFA